MEFLQLEYFKVVARMQHMTKAATKLNISQPALSNSIARLEKELGVPLFDRERRQIRLNQSGEAFLAKVDKMFKELEDGKREALDLANRLEKSVSLAITLPNLMPILLEKYVLKYPDVHIKQYSSSSGKMIKQLENYEVDFGISIGPVHGENIEWRHLLDEPVYLTVPRDHQFAHRKSIALHEAKNESFISFEDKFEFRRLTDNYCYEAGFQPKTKIEFEDPFSILRFVDMGYGVSFTPQLSLLQNYFPNIVQVPISEPTCIRSLGVAWNKQNFLSKAALDFKEFILDFFNNEVEKLSND